MDSNTLQSEVTECKETSNANTRNPSRWWVKMDIQGRKFSRLLEIRTSTSSLFSFLNFAGADPYYSLGTDALLPLLDHNHHISM